MKERLVPSMDKKQFRSEKNYLAAREITQTLMHHGLLTHEEFVQFDTMFRKKFSPVFGVLLAENPCNFSKNDA